jgi:hypothetical protein
MKHDLATLSKFIQEPVKISAASWGTAQLGRSGGLGPSDWALEAVLKISREDLQFLISSSNTLPAGENPSLDRRFVSNWFPEELRSRLVGDDKTYFRFNVPGYKADLFAKSPLLNGYFVPISEEQIFLFLHTS